MSPWEWGLLLAGVWLGIGIGLALGKCNRRGEW